MAKKFLKKAKKPLASDKPATRPVAVDPVNKPAQKRQSAAVSKAVATGTPAVKPPEEAAPAQEPPHLLTPLTALWPAVTLWESPKPPGKAPVTEKTSTATAPRIVKVTFVLLDLGARQVFLCGDFNGWSSSATPMKRDDAGLWETTIALAPGRYQYKFVVDGHWIPDPLAREHVWNQHGTLNSVIEARA